MKLNLIEVLTPELIVGIGACILFLLGVAKSAGSRQMSAALALLTLVIAFVYLLTRTALKEPVADAFNTLHVGAFANYIKLLTVGVGILFVLLSWPNNDDSTGNSALNYGTEAGEYFGLMLFSLTGLLLTSSANDIITLFLAIELASIPTYVMVSVSRPVPAAQEAGVKYFFLGAMAAAVMLFGFSYLYGSTGTIHLNRMIEIFKTSISDGGHSVQLTSWQMLAAVMLIGGFAFKLAAAPLHFYAADVYQGAATPVTAFLSFVPKATGLVALIKILHVIGGGAFHPPAQIISLLGVIAVLTMTLGNILGLLQLNVKRVLAYSSIAHSGYMLVGVTTLIASTGSVQDNALRGVLFYLTAYGLMNAAAFGVLMLLPSRKPAAATSAETFDDLAGLGRKHPALGLAMAVASFSLIGLPFTVGFWGKAALIMPALEGGLYWLVIFTMVNAAISAAYYLKIIAAMYLRTEAPGVATPSPRASAPIALAITVSAVASLALGVAVPLTQKLADSLKTETGALRPEYRSAPPAVASASRER